MKNTRTVVALALVLGAVSASAAVKKGAIVFDARNQMHIVWGREVCTEGISEPKVYSWQHGIRADRDPATLVLAFKKPGTTVCTCIFRQDLSLVWNPDRADTELVLSNRVSTMMGELHVSNGTLRVTAEAGLPFLTRLVIGPHGRLVIDPSAAIVFTEKLEVAPGGRLEVADPAKLDVFTDKKMAQLEPREKWATGPVANAEDQLRCFPYVEGSQYERARDLGMNTIIALDKQMNDIVYRKMARDGVGFMLYNEIHDRDLYRRYARVGKNGKAQDAYDALLPGFMEEWRARYVQQLRAASTRPTAVGLHAVSELWNRVAPCWSEPHKAAWTAFSGKPWPATCCEWRPAPHWSKLKDLPADRLIDDDYTPYQFYRWFWHDDLHYPELMDMAVDLTTKAFGRPMMTMMDPCIRFPPLWAPAGGKVGFVNEWVSCAPVPFQHSYIVSKQKAMARGAGQGVITQVQGIFSRGDCAPANRPLPPNAPEWARVYTNGSHVVPPCDMMREAFWSVFARQLDGINTYGNWTLFATEAYGRPRFSSGCCEPNTEPMIRDIFARVGIPLGPLFRAAPERPPEVALLETLPSALLSNKAPYDWKIGLDTMRCGTVATGANLAPYTLYDDEILRDGIPPSVKVILAPEAAVLTKRVAAKLKEFQARGGKILARDDFAPGMKRDGALPPTLMEDRPNTEFGTTSCRNPNFSGQEYDDDLRRAQGNFRTAIAGVLPGWKPYADSDNAYLQVYARQAGAADLLFAQNTKRGRGWFMGAWGRILDKGLPNAGTVWVERPAGAAYDLVKHAAVPFAVKGGRTEIKVSYETTEGNVFLLTKRPLAALKGSAMRTAGGVTVVVTAPERDVMRPFGVIADGAKPFYAILKNGTWSRTFVAGAKIEILDLATGERTPVAESLGYYRGVMDALGR